MSDKCDSGHTTSRNVVADLEVVVCQGDLWHFGGHGLFGQEISIPSSPSPSDSIDRFRNNRKFTIGEWVYNQSVNNFKGGNIYFRPLYDKGYNFTRRYVPEPSKNIMPERINIPTSIPGNTINQEKFFSENFVPSSNSISQIPPIE